MKEASSQDKVSMPTAELTFFRTALGAFVKSAAKFQVACTAPIGHGVNGLPRLAPSLPRPPFQKLIVLDSSFNPPTVAHMQMATSAIRDLQHSQQTSCRLLLLLSVNNADKAPKPAPFEHRLALMLAMAKDMHKTLGAEPGQSSSSGEIPIDIGLTSQPYFHDKSRAIATSNFYTTSPEPEQVFLIGYDTLIRVFDAKYYTQPAEQPNVDPLQAALTPFLRRARLRVTTRPDDQWGSLDEQEQWLQNLSRLGGSEDWIRRVVLAAGPYRGSDIVSSTMARRAAKAQDWAQLKPLVGPSVLSWIESNRLYGE